MNPWRTGALALLLGVFGWHGAVAQIVSDGRSGRVSPFRGGQTTYMFRWDIPPDAYLEKNWLDQPQALGSIFKLRPDALEHGITLAGTYTSYTLGNVCGGQSTGVTYLDMFFASAVIDLGKLWGWNGWSISLSARQVEGSFMADVVGTTPITSPSPEPNRTFRRGQISAHLPNPRRYNRLLPANDWVRSTVVGDVWICDDQGNIAPGLVSSPVPVPRTAIGIPIARMPD